MKGGVISGNSANNGGGMEVWGKGTFTLEGGTIYGKADSLPANTNPSLANSAEGGDTATLNVADEATVNWGTGGTYTKGSETQTGGSDIGSTDETLIAVPKK
jgi:hypothetical protein